MSVLVVPANSEPYLAPLPPQNRSLDFLKEKVGGWIEAVAIRDDVMMYLNEEGKLYGLPINDLATNLYVARYGPIDVIVGDVVFVGWDGSPDEVDLSPDAEAWLMKWVSI